MDISDYRKKIDEIDGKIVDLLNQRYEAAQKIGGLKQKKSKEIYVPEREKAVLARIDKLNKGIVPPKALRAIYREIMSGAISLEKPLQIGYFGAEASFTHLAALGKFGHCAGYVPRAAISDVFNDVEADRIDYGVVPVENSTEGAINHTLDMFLNSTVKICAEINMRIHHNLMAKCRIKEVKRIYSHSQVLSQCRSWLQENMPSVEIIEVSSSARAAEQVRSEKGSAAVASRLASELYGLDILAEHIEDIPDNTTRFIVISKQNPQPTGDDKTSLCYAVKDRVGALYDSLLPFKEENITLTMIESRPSKRRNWEYFFFIDFLGHAQDEKSAKVMEKLSNYCQFVKILGSYPKSGEIL